MIIRFVPHSRFVAAALLVAGASSPALGENAPGAKSGGSLRWSVTTVDAETIEVGQLVLTQDHRLTGTLGGGESKSWSIDDLVRLMPAGRERDAEEPLRGPDVCVFHTAGGGALRGRLLADGESSGGSIRADVSLGGVRELQLSGLAGVRVASGELAEIESEFQTRIAERKAGSDTMILMRAGKPVPVNGSLERLDARGWDFRYGGKTRSGTLEHVYGFVFGAPAMERDQPQARVVLRNGDQFPADLVSSRDERLALESPAMGAIEVSWGDVAAIEIRSDRIVALSSLKPTDERQRSLADAQWPARMNTNVLGGPIRLGPKSYAVGIGVHAYSALTFDLDGNFERFSAVIGIDESAAPNGSAIFRVMVDGKAIYESPMLRGGGKSETVSVSIAGAKSLTLECDPADELDLSDHANWANAVIIRSAKKGKR